jgi:hypothetical protein
MAVVKHLCGECGAEVRPEMALCPQCSQPLNWERSAGEVSHKKTPARQSVQKSAGKRLEPWQMISIVAVLGLIVLFVVMELSRDHSSLPASSSAVSVPPLQTMMPTPTVTAPFEQVVAANPSDPAPLLKLANVLHDNGSYDRAIETYKKYLTMKPADPDARVDLGICYYELGIRDTVNATARFTLAAKEMETASKKSPSHQPAAFNLGIVNLHLGNLEESTKWFRKTVELDKDSELGRKAQQMLSQHTFTP